MSQAVFERHEKKYLLTTEQMRRLSQALQPHMTMDEYGLHTICSLYCDTDDYATIRHSLDKPHFKEKLRLRSYGIPKENDRVFLELKKKFNGITYKRRIPLTMREARDWLADGAKPSESGQILEEIDWFMRKFECSISPKVLICYDRIALSGVENPQLRVTFDADVRWRDYNLDPARGDYGSPVIPPFHYLMEIKTLQALPCWLSAMLSELAVYPASFSKYGAVYREHLVCREELRHVG